MRKRRMGTHKTLHILLLGVGFMAAVPAAARPAEIPSATAAPAEPSPAVAIVDTLKKIHRTYRALDEGSVYKSGAESVEASWFGIAVATVDGEIHAVGETERPFPIQSTAKTFTYALALKDHGAATLLERIGVNATGLPYNSPIASEVRPRRLQNPMVSAGAIATIGLIRGSSDEEKWRRVQDAFALFAGDDLPLNSTVFDYEISNSTQSYALAYGLLARDLLRLPCENGEQDCFVAPEEDDVSSLVRLYLKSISQDVTARQLAVMGATLANGGVNPKTGVRAASPETVSYVLSAMLTAGMYDASGEWLSRVGLPAKSGVSGNILAVVPGRLAIVVYSPPLDASGNSVRGAMVIEELARRWSLHLLSSANDPE